MRVYVLQGFAEIRHFCVCLGRFHNCLGISVIAEAVSDMGNKWYLIYYIQNLGKGTVQKTRF
jgi:hypothetical protein